MSIHFYYAPSHGHDNHINDACVTIEQLMKRTGTPVALYFNGTFVECKPGESAAEIGQRWIKERERQQAGCTSP